MRLPAAQLVIFLLNGYVLTFIYLVGIQQRRSEKIVQTVYGIVTDGVHWVFMRLNSKKQLSTSETLP